MTVVGLQWRNGIIMNISNVGRQEQMEVMEEKEVLVGKVVKLEQYNYVKINLTIHV